MTRRPETPEEFSQAHLRILEKIIDRASADPEWKKRLLSDPQAAFDEAGLLPEIDALNPATAEVVGQGWAYWSWTCPYTAVLKCSSPSGPTPMPYPNVTS
jgi:hypothetical protein